MVNNDARLENEEDLGEEEDGLLPGMTVGDLRRSIEGVRDDYKVVIRVNDEFGGGAAGVIALGLEEGCDGIKRFVLDASDDEDDFG